MAKRKKRAVTSKAFDRLQGVNKLMATGMVASQLFSITLPVAQASAFSHAPTTVPIRKYFKEHMLLASADIVPPAPTVMLPQGSGVAIDAKLYLNFDEPVQLGDGSVFIRREDGTLEALIYAWEGTPLSGTIAISGTSVNLSFDAVLAAGTNYYVEINSDLFKDMAGNPYSGFSGDGMWTFRTAEATSPPVMVSVYPQGSGIQLTEGLQITFNEPVRWGAGEVALHRASDGQIVRSFVVSGGAPLPGYSGMYGLGASGRSMWLQVPFSGGASYYVTISPGTIEDMSGYAFSGIMDTTTWDFSTIDPPTVSALWPQGSGAGLAVDGKLQLQFSEPVQLGSGQLGLRRQSDGGMGPTLYVMGSGRFLSSGTISISGTSVTVGFDDVMAKGTGYYVQIDPYVFVDMDGHPFSGIWESGMWTFRTTDMPVEPRMVKASPMGSGTPLWESLRVTFDEAVEWGTGELAVHRADTGEVVKRLAFSGGSPIQNTSGYWFDDQKLYVSAELESGTSYYVTISSGAIVDKSGLAFGGIIDTTTWDFSTLDTTPPMPTDTSPYGSGIAVSEHLRVQFSERVRLGEGYVEVRRIADGGTAAVLHVSGSTVTGGSIQISGRSVVIDPDATLAEGTSYYVQIGSGTFLDMAGLGFSGILGSGMWTFHTTAETSPPVMVSVYPQGSDIQLSERLQITFNEPVRWGAGEVALHRASDGQIVRSFVVSGGAPLPGYSGMYGLGASGRSMWLQVPFSGGASYYVTISPGTIEDMSGYAFSGIMDTTTWDFSTIDPPTVSALWPQGSGAGLAVDGKLQLQFSEPVRLGSGQLGLRRQSDGGMGPTLYVMGSGRFLSSGTISMSGTMVTVGFDDVMAKGTGYYVQIDPYVFVDTDGHPFSGIWESGMWTFRTTDMPVEPRMVKASPMGSGAPLWESLRVTFDEAVEWGTGELAVHRADTGEVVKRLAFSGGSPIQNTSGYYWSYDDQKLYVSAELESGTSYYVTISSGAIVDKSGLAFGGIIDTTTWDFSTLDTTPPMPTDTSPYGSGIAVSEHLRVQFSERVRLGEGYVEVRRIADGGTAAVLHVSGSTVTGGGIQISGRSVVIDPDATLAGGTSYYVQIGPGTFLDMAGHGFSGILDSFQWTFRTAEAASPPPITPTTPGTGPLLPADSATQLEEQPKPEATVPPQIKPAKGAQVLAPTPQQSPGGTATFSVKDISPDAATLVYYYDERYKAWIAAPTSIQDGELAAEVPPGSWATLMKNPAVAQPADSKDSWANKDILKLMSLGIVEGFDDGSFQPKSTGDRYQIAVLMAKAAKLDIASVDQTVLDALPDQTAIPTWARPYVAAVLQAGLMNGKGVGFAGAELITRAEMAALVGRMLPDDVGGDAATYSDDGDIPEWAREGVARARKLGIMDGFPDQSFKPDELLTREQMAAVISRLLDTLIQ